MANILIAEDEIHTVLSLRILLKRSGYTAVFVGDGEQALALLRKAKLGEEARFDLLLTDIQMPKLNGLELIRAMKSEGIVVPVLVFTGFGDKNTLVELLHEGCEDYIDKPFTESELLARVAKTLEKDARKRGAQTQLEENLLEARRQLESYRAAFSDSCESVENAVSAYKRIMGAPLASSRIGVFAKMASKDRLGGDYCALRDQPWGCDLIVADVAGHDLGASYHTVLLKSFFDINSIQGKPGDEFLRSLNDELLDGGCNERMICALFARVNLEEAWLETVAAGHPYLLSVRPGMAVECRRHDFSPGGLPLGILRDPVMDKMRAPIVPGERFYIFTDGLPDAKSLDTASGAREKLGMRRLSESIKSATPLPLAESVEKIWNDVMQFCGGRLSDDMLLLGLEIPPGADKQGDPGR